MMIVTEKFWTDIGKIVNSKKTIYGIISLFKIFPNSSSSLSLWLYLGGSPGVTN